MTTSASILHSGESKMATISRRSLAALIDMVIVGLGVWFPIFAIWGEYDRSAGQYQVKGIPALVLFGLSFAYFFIFEWLWAATVGKLLLDLRVFSIKGGKCTFSESFKRNLVRPLDFFVFYLVGFVAAKLSPLNQRLGDQWARTVVLQKKPDETVKRSFSSDEHLES